MFRDGSIVGVPFLDVGVSSGEMCGKEAKTCVMILQPDTHSPFVPRHTPQPSLRTSELKRLRSCMEIQNAPCETSLRHSE